MNQTNHSSLISTWFNTGAKSCSDLRKSASSACNSALLFRPGQITLITGPSGSGKSTLLRRLRRRCPIPITDIATVPLANSSVIDLFSHIRIEDALAHLSRVGLAEAHIYLSTARKLSDGQRWRLRLALALSRVRQRKACLVCDEFASLLDSVTAAVISRVLRNTVAPASTLGAILATSRENLIRPLAPDQIIRCNFGSLELWKKKGECYVRQTGEGAQPVIVHPRAVDPRTRHAR
jgi:ABC-type ATPase with predicted acetyltransferase domain